MSTLGYCQNITHLLKEKSAIHFSQWIGCSNVVRNQKIVEFKNSLSNKKPLNQGYASIKNNEDLIFLKDTPVQILRNASSMVYRDLIASQKGLRRFPKIKKKHLKRNFLITKELFFIEQINKKSSRICILESAKKGANIIFSIIVPFLKNDISNQIRISRKGQVFSLSFSFNDNITRFNNDDLLKDFSHLDEKELLSHITGVDRGVARPIFTSNGLILAYNPQQKEKLKEISHKKAHYQRILARQKRRNKNKTKKCESNRQRKMAHKISNCDKKLGNIRLNASHDWSKQLANSSTKIMSFEALKLKNMTKKAKAKRDETGRKYVKNNARAKSGLNRALLNVAIGRIGDLTKYKLNLQSKAWVEINPANTSKIHYACGGKNTERPKQDTLKCLDCMVELDADFNASMNIASRGAIKIKENKFTKKKSLTKISIRKIKKKNVVNESSSQKKLRSVVVVEV